MKSHTSPLGQLSPSPNPEETETDVKVLSHTRAQSHWTCHTRTTLKLCPSENDKRRASLLLEIQTFSPNLFLFGLTRRKRTTESAGSTGPFRDWTTLRSQRRTHSLHLPFLTPGYSEEWKKKNEPEGLTLVVGGTRLDPSEDLSPPRSLVQVSTSRKKDDNLQSTPIP